LTCLALVVVCAVNFHAAMSTAVNAGLMSAFIPFARLLPVRQLRKVTLGDLSSTGLAAALAPMSIFLTAGALLCGGLVSMRLRKTKPIRVPIGGGLLMMVALLIVVTRAAIYR
jgi:hypothetical protein